MEGNGDMSFNKTTVDVVIETEHKEWLEAMARKHSLEDTSKALRVVLDYAIEADAEEEIFQQIRCRFC